MIDVRRCTVAELEAAPNLAELIAEYASESSLPELGAPNPQVETYRVMERVGILHPIAAFDEERLAGFILPIVVVLPHYGVVASTVESFFVPRAERKERLGMHLLDHAKALSRGFGAKAMLISAPADGALSRVLSRTPRYRKSNDVFIAALA